MARKTLDRKKLRAEAEAVTATKKDTAKAERPAKVKAVKVPGVKKPRVKRIKVPPRMRVRWCIYDGGMKAVAVFDYNQLAEAKVKLAEYLEKKPSYFMQLLKDELPLPELEVTSV